MARRKKQVYTDPAIAAAVKACRDAQAKLDPYDVQNARRNIPEIFRCALKKLRASADTPRGTQIELAVTKVVSSERSKRYNVDPARARASRKRHRIRGLQRRL